MTASPARVTFCTLAGPSLAAQTAALAESIRRAHPEARLVIGQLGRDWDASGWDQALGADAGSSDRPGAFPTLPELVDSCLEEGAESVVYVAPTALLYAPLDPVLTALSGAAMVLLPRVAQLPADGALPGAAELLESGRVSGACIGFSAAAESILSWWGAQMGRSPDTVAERWLELVLDGVAGLGPDAPQPEVVLLEDPGCGLSYWNLHERHLNQGPGGVRVNDSPLRLMDFPGFHADRPYWLSTAATRVRVAEDPVLSARCGEYAQTLIAHGWRAPVTLDALDRLGNSQRVDRLVRWLWTEAVTDGEDFGDPRDGAAADAFTAWMRAPAELGGSHGVNRYMYAAYRERSDLYEAFPNLDGPDGGRFLDWAWEHGRRELIGELLPPAPDGLTALPRTGLAVNVIGFLGETLGLGEAARLYVTGLQAAGVPVSTTAIRPELPVEDEQANVRPDGSRAYTDIPAVFEPHFNLACMNGDHLAQLVNDRGRSVLGGRPTIGQWGWETDVLPPSWNDAFALVDEVWVYTTFVAENLGRLLPVPVVVVPPAVIVPEVASESPFGYDDRFTFLFMLDLFSTVERKNPLGLMDAFMQAFAPGEGPRLLIKTMNARLRPEAWDQLRHRAAGRSDIEFLDGYLEPAEKSALIQGAGCYVSLHRSEGFGLTLAESMALGVPVISTGYSGNMDFTTAQNAYLVDSKPVRVGVGSAVYPPLGLWAEPDIAHAANQLRRVWSNQAEAASRAERARADINRLYAPRVVGEIARARLERLNDHRAAQSMGTDPVEVTAPELESVALTHAEQELGFDLRRGLGATSSPAQQAARKLALRLMLPFTVHERRFDYALIDALKEQSANGASVAMALSELRAELTRLRSGA